MKTTPAYLLGLDEELEFTGEVDPRPMGRLHVDAAVRNLLRVPRALPEMGSAPIFPGLRLEGRDGMWIELRRCEPGRMFHLSMKDGEEDQPTEEMQAVSRVRLFVEHWGEETHLTSEIRLSPEQRRKIADMERARDRERRKRMPEGNRVVFKKRVYLVPCLLFVLGTAALAGALALFFGPEGVAGAAAAALLALGSLGGLWLLFKNYRIEVDRTAGIIRVVAFDGATYVGELDEFQHADVKELPKQPGSRGVFVVTRDDAPIRVGRRAWSAKDAKAIAEAINDALDVAEADRKYLSYRRSIGRGNE